MSVEVKDWHGARAIPLTPLEGQYARIEPLDMRKHGQDLWDAFGGSVEAVAQHLRYAALPPFDSRESFFRFFTKANRATLLDRLTRSLRRRRRRLYFACIDKASGQAAGIRCLGEIDYVHGSVDFALTLVGGAMLRARSGSEVSYLITSMLFETCGFRRLESRVFLENEQSRRYSQRKGWHFDGISRQRYVHQGRSFNAAIYSILADEWLPIRDAYRAWLEPSNFDAEGRQIRRLEDFRK